MMKSIFKRYVLPVILLVNTFFYTPSVLAGWKDFFKNPFTSIYVFFKFVTFPIWGIPWLIGKLTPGSTYQAVVGLHGNVGDNIGAADTKKLGSSFNAQSVVEATSTIRNRIEKGKVKGTGDETHITLLRVDEQGNKQVAAHTKHCKGCKEYLVVLTNKFIKKDGTELVATKKDVKKGKKAVRVGGDTIDTNDIWPQIFYKKHGSDVLREAKSLFKSIKGQDVDTVLAQAQKEHQFNDEQKKNARELINKLAKPETPITVLRIEFAEEVAAEGEPGVTTKEKEERLALLKTDDPELAQTTGDALESKYLNSEYKISAIGNT